MEPLVEKIKSVFISSFVYALIKELNCAVLSTSTSESWEKRKKRQACCYMFKGSPVVSVQKYVGDVLHSWQRLLFVHLGKKGQTVRL